MDPTRIRTATVITLVCVFAATAAAATVATVRPSPLATAFPPPTATGRPSFTTASPPPPSVAAGSPSPSRSATASPPVTASQPAASQPMATPFVDPDAGRAPTPTMPFDSAVYDYRVRFPSGWSPEPSKAAPAPDVIEGVGYRWFGTARTVEPGTSLASFVRSHPLDRLVNGECVLRGAGSVTIRPPVGSTEWEPAEIAGRRALRRSSCGYVDAVVIAERTLYRFTLRRAAVEGDVESFERLAATIELPLAFRSKANGYRLTLPPGWEATKDWESDVFKAPKPSKAQISVTRRHLSGQPLDLFATGALPNRVTGDGCHWKSPGIIWIPAGARSFLSTTIAGRKALVRDECGFVDAVVDLGDDALVIVLRSGIRRPDGDRYTFDRLVESLQIEGRP